MPALISTEFTATVSWLGVVQDRDASLAATARETLQLTFDGPVGESHGGAFRPSCGRVLDQHPRGTPIRNVRQLSVVSAEDLNTIAATLGLNQIDPAWIGATLVVQGLPDLSLLPPSSRLQGPDGVTLVVDMENRPCHFPDKVIREGVGRDSLAATFKSAAQGRRGVTAWVEREGSLSLGDTLTLHIPDQPAWPHLGTARGALL